MLASLNISTEAISWLKRHLKGMLKRNSVQIIDRIRIDQGIIPPDFTWKLAPGIPEFFTT